MNYALVMYNYATKSSQVIYFNNIREALNVFTERCDALGYQYREDNNGNFHAGGVGNDYMLELTSIF